MDGSHAAASRCDVALVGGGLANVLIASSLRHTRPDLSVGIYESALGPGPAKTWSVFQTDVTPEAWAMLQPSMEAEWSGYSVAFPSHTRSLGTRYASLSSNRLLSTLSAQTPIQYGRSAVSVLPDQVVFDDGSMISARVVIDGRGAAPSRNVELGFQKFVGLELALAQPHGLVAPIVMDASVAQDDGYRFLYVLPLDPTRLLVEDTRYSDDGRLDRGVLECAALRYARGQGWNIRKILRREEGVLPIILSGDVDDYFSEPGRNVPQVGMRGLFFHPTTGYSLPDAVRIADLVAQQPLRSSAELATVLQQTSRKLWRDRSFYRTLNRMLFKAAEPSERYRVLERFYQLPQPLIERFYSGRTTLADKIRILAGKPPVPIGRALAALPA